MKDLTQGSIARHVATMAAQMGAGLLLQTLYFFVDLYFVAKLGDAAIAGVGAAGNVTFVIIALTQAMGVGTVSLVAQAVGRKDREAANHVFNQSVSMAAAGAIATLVAGYALAEPYMRTFGADPETVRQGIAFMHGYLPGMALQFATVVMASGLRGTGIVKPTMVVQALTVVLNAVLAPMLTVGWLTGRPFGTLGAGLATSIAVVAGVILLAAYFLRLEHYVAFDAKQWKPKLATWGRMLYVGIPAGGEFFMLSLFIALMYWAIRPFGSEAQAGYAIGARINQMVFVPALAIAFSLSPVAGQNFGARRAERVRETLRVGLVQSCVVMTALTVAILVFAGAAARIFTNEPAVVAVAAEYLHYIAWIFPTAGVVMTCSNIFQGIGNTWPSLGASVLRLVTFGIPGYWMARQPWFRMEHIFLLAVATSWLQAGVSYAWLRAELRKRLDFSPAGTRASIEPPGESRSPAA
jgi:putative MATE family efflux protein